MTGESNNTSSIMGMSRAARKRAKKKKKAQQQLQQQQEEQQDDNEKNFMSKERLEPSCKKAKLNNNNSNKPAPISKKHDDDCESDVETESTLPSSSFNNNNGAATVTTTTTKNNVNNDNDQDVVVSFDDASLKQILMLENSKNEEQEHVLHSMTAKQRARCLFQAMIAPITVEQFYNEYWEKKPLFLQATSNNPNNKHRYNGFLSLKSIQEMSKTIPLYYGRDLNVTKYQAGPDGIKRRVTLDKIASNDKNKNENDDNATLQAVQVNSKELWKLFDQGHTIRLLCPHKHNNDLHSLLSLLETEFGCMVGANAYLTPSNGSQGFAPHWDDIEAFCLQLEGRKKWKVYKPTYKLPRVSSEDFTTDDLKEMEAPVMDIIAEPGDLLYMPRGWIHQACTLQEESLSNNDNNGHSLHLTASAMQQWAWADLLDIVIPNALQEATAQEASTSLRQGLPRNFLEYMGVMYDKSVDENLPESIKKCVEEPDDDNDNDHDGDNDNEDGDNNNDNESNRLKEMKQLQEQFRQEAKKRIMKVAKTAHELLDAACDEMGKRFLSDRLPPALSATEIIGTSNDNDNNNLKKQQENNDNEESKYNILPNTLCRLARPGIARLVIEDGKAILYHCMDNSRVFHENPLSPLEFEMDDGPALEQLITTVEPRWIAIEDLFHDTIEDKIAIAQSLFDEGVLAVRN